MTTDGLSRRQALTGAATVGVGLPLLAACGGKAAAPAEEQAAAPAKEQVGEPSTPGQDSAVAARSWLVFPPEELWLVAIRTANTATAPYPMPSPRALIRALPSVAAGSNRTPNAAVSNRQSE